ncbi:hypothetical protein [Haloferula sp.]|uniref:hypothetical protein n=1 Tax=Haloferula sp. TaxID=2497595 RepID=UPI003AF62791
MRDFYADQVWMFVPDQAYVAKFLETFKEFPPSSGDSLSIDAVLNTMKSAQSRQQSARLIEVVSSHPPISTDGFLLFGETVSL